MSNYVAGAADSPVSTHTTADAAAAQKTVVEYAAPVAPALNEETTFLSGLNPDGTLALYSYAAWNNDRPATYTGGYTLAYKWHADGSAPTAGTPGGIVTYAFNAASGWNADETAAFTAALTLWSAVANISFSLTSDYGHAGIQFTRGSDDRAYADSDFAPLTQDTGRTDGNELLRLEQSKVSIDTSVAGFGPIGSFSGPNNIFSRSGGYPLHTILHEIGHAIGLGHGGPYNGTKVASQQYGPYDTRLYSLMSYFNNSSANQYTPVHSTFWNSRYPITPMIADILAIQRIYGAATDTPLTDVTFGYNTTISGPVANFFDFNTNTTPVVTLWAAGSNNALDLSNTSDATINLNPGTFSSTHGLTNNIAIAYDTRIGRLVGSAGGTTVTGNDGGNHIDGAGGDDVIHGGSGNDTLLGGTGADRIYGGGGVNTITGGSESDTAGYALAWSTYAITRNGDGSLLITGGGVSDTLREIELLEFADQTIAVTSLGAGAILGGDAGTGAQMPSQEEQ
ncbi:MAG TPA: M10 family metallopeptidase C-terminal domain-containing protein, partial [Rhizomicrobium sp.]|nr:M10 family metallopeptidase C-terminal domain-containing protein [Rhizomicrobium sp.]